MSRLYWKLSEKWIMKLKDAGFEFPSDTPSGKGYSSDDYASIFLKLLGDCADEAYIGKIESHNNGLTHGRTTWTIEDFEDQEERNYDNLADGLADTWIRNKKKEDD